MGLSLCLALQLLVSSINWLRMARSHIEASVISRVSHTQAHLRHAVVAWKAQVLQT